MLNKATFLVSRRFSSKFTTPLLPKGALAYINGQWVESKKKKTFDVKNPFNGELLYKTTDCEVTEAEKVRCF
ncbi:hypothetical protein ANCCAN_25851 [Ancylostoma caninum]|uniref:Aldehyde dehydrogenase domain-containing protein n=1 Tax=Ancylostoma caninum TaxID=29170 RepID=A0A368EZ85_ANCCA|nr:hypothetical protein ANCCAN_30201 [Ancylostoma caninum]RCN28401.1 hypothetical protein ANCCAN_25851 [Ancylostoma caninum]